MIKTLLFCALFACAFADTRDWSGLWSVVKQENATTGFCDVPQPLSVVIISSYDILSLEGLSAITKATTVWPLGWGNKQQFGSYCQEDGWCVTGSLIYNSKGIFANITWKASQDPSTSCSALLTPITVDWTGDWFVQTSLSYDHCPVPIQDTVVNIKAYGDQMLLIGNSTETKMISGWPLNFTSTDLEPKHACIDSLNVCSDGILAYQDNYVMGILTWLVDDTIPCDTIIMKIPTFALETFDESDLSGLFPEVL